MPGSNEVAGVKVSGYHATTYNMSNHVSYINRDTGIRILDNGGKNTGHFVVVDLRSAIEKDLTKVFSPYVVHFDDAEPRINVPDSGHTGEPAKPQ